MTWRVPLIPRYLPPTPPFVASHLWPGRPAVKSVQKNSNLISYVLASRPLLAMPNGRPRFQVQSWRIYTKHPPFTACATPFGAFTFPTPPPPLHSVHDNWSCAPNGHLRSNVRPLRVTFTCPSSPAAADPDVLTRCERVSPLRSALLFGIETPQSSE
jgi:hypothetical protein